MSAAALRYQRPRVQGPGAAGQNSMPLTDERRGMLSKVHLAKKALGLDEAAYRDVVERITGGRSSAAASDAALHRLLAEFARLGWRPSRRQAAPLRSSKEQIRMIHAVWADLSPYVSDSSDSALRSFVRRQTRSALHPDGMATPEFLDGRQASRVLEALKSWLARVSKGAGA